MNRIDRLYALVEELRAAGERGRTAQQLARHFEVMMWRALLAEAVDFARGSLDP